MSIKVAVFDFDGVIVDSNQLKTDAWSVVFKDDPHITPALVANIVSRNVGTRFDILRDIFVLAGKPPAEINGLVEEYAAKYDAVVQANISQRGLAQGAHEVLKDLQSRMCLYINSATPEHPLRATVQNLGIADYFKEVLGMPPSKEENLQAILAREGVTPAETVMIGDGQGDWYAAHSVGTHFIAVASGFHDWTPYTDGFPIVSGIHEAPDIFAKLS